MPARPRICSWMIYLFWGETTNCIPQKNSCLCFGNITTNGVHTKNTGFHAPTIFFKYVSSNALQLLGIGWLYDTITGGLVYLSSKETFFSFHHPSIVVTPTCQCIRLGLYSRQARTSNIFGMVIRHQSTPYVIATCRSVHMARALKEYKGVVFLWNSRFQWTLYFLHGRRTAGQSPSCALRCHISCLLDSVFLWDMTVSRHPFDCSWQLISTHRNAVNYSPARHYVEMSVSRSSCAKILESEAPIDQTQLGVRSSATAIRVHLNQGLVPNIYSLYGYWNHESVDFNIIYIRSSLVFSICQSYILVILEF